MRSNNTLAGISSLVQVTLPLDTNVFVSQYILANILYQEISRQCRIYILVFISSQYYTLAGILDQETSRVRRLYIPKYIRPPSIIRQLVYYIKRHLGNATYIYQCPCALLALYAGRHTILKDVQGMLPIYANVFTSQHYTLASTLHQGKSRARYLYMLLYAGWHTRLGDIQGTPPIYTKVYASSQCNTPASILYQEISRQCRVYIPMSSRPPSVIRQLAYYIRRRLGYTTYIYQCLRALLALYTSQYTISREVQGTLPIYTNVFISQYYILAGTLYQEMSRVYYLYIPISLYPSIIYQLVYYIKGRQGNAVYIYQYLHTLLALYAGRYSILGDIQEIPPIYTKVYVLLALYASQYTILGDIQYTPPIYTNIFISQYYIPASILYQGTSSIYHLYILVFISQHYTNISSRNYILAARLYLRMPRLRCLQVPNYCDEPVRLIL